MKSKWTFCIIHLVCKLQKAEKARFFGNTTSRHVNLGTFVRLSMLTSQSNDENVGSISQRLAFSQYGLWNAGLQIAVQSIRCE